MFSVTMTSKSAGRLKQVHRRGVDEQVLDRELRELVRNTRVATSRHSRDVSSTLALSTEVTLRRRPMRELAGHAAHALDLGDRVFAGVERGVGRAVALTEVDAAGQFADHEDVDTLRASPASAATRRRARAWS